jgi:hypothetical protein
MVICVSQAEMSALRGQVRKTESDLRESDRRVSELQATAALEKEHFERLAERLASRQMEDQETIRRTRRAM